MALRKLSLTLSDLPSYELCQSQENFLKQRWKQSSGLASPRLRPRRFSTSALSTYEHKSYKNYEEINKKDRSKDDCAESAVPLAFLSYENKANAKNGEQNNKSPLIIHHNLIGSKENWKTACMEIYHVTKRSVFAVDARNHGDSPHTNNMCYTTMAKDVEQFAKQTKSPKVSFIGHSFGGRVGLLLAMLRPDLFDKIVIVDSSPFIDKGSLDKWEMLREASAILKEIEDELKSCSGVARKTLADKSVEHVLPNKCDRALFLSNLLTTENTDKLWKINLEALLSNPGLMSDYPSLFFGLDSQYHGPVLFISGEKSQTIKKEDEEAIKIFFPNTDFAWLPKTGQWMHLEKHGELMKKVVTYLEAQ